MAATTLPTLLNHPILIAMIGAVLGLLFGVLLMQLAKVKLSDRYQRQQLADATELQQRQEQLERLQAELAMVKGNNQDLDQNLQQHRARIRELELDQVRLQQVEAQKHSQDDELAEQHEQVDHMQRLLSQRQARIAELESRLESERESQSEKLQLLTEARDQLKSEFQNLANKIFEEKSAKFSAANKDSLGSLLTPLRDQLGEFKRRVDDVYDKEAKDRRSLYEQISQLKELNQQMSADAVNLTNALKGESKTQGNWGEVILERVLEQSGLRKGYEYETQVSLNEEGQRYMPDVIIRLPDNKDVIVDAKVSLTAYEQYCSSDESRIQDQALASHLQSIRNHVRGLSDKAYQSLEGVRSLDFVLMFIPVEGAFLLALQQDKELFSFAYERNIILVSPSTLLVTLRTINNIWRYERQNRFAQEIAHRGGELHDKFVGFVESLDDVGRHLGRTQAAYETAHKRLSTGRGNLVSQAASLHKLGVKSKKELDKKLTDNAVDSDPDAEQLEILD
ncbi:DNA recombination protein RmuC [Amphritea opalescens]|uniref:DNA recombination protein RmuC n=1 Tax=Amphritea opalescens TaxID=2490544 RepID=A0A430KNJ3_9GAMM|nr:DNA recombination protein RmuC [Amphritea opalescens]RTE64933.1 DNA recombination protein RmuC [Amphritea opalescens]